MALSAAEQYLIELINRARLDPLAEAQRYGIGLNDGIASSRQIAGEAMQVLAPNALLELAAERHSAWMLAADVFGHTGSGGSTPRERMEAAGYELVSPWTTGENISMSGSTGPIDLDAMIASQYDALFRSAGHRATTLDARFMEIGVAQVEGRFTQNGRTFNTSMLTENFARSGSDVFLTGVAYDDRNGNAFYGIGEGLAGIRVAANGASAATATAGGYAVALAPDADAAVTVTQGTTVLARLTVDLSLGSGKLDLVRSASGWELALSASAALVSGVANARLLGEADLDLTGSGAANRLTGNRGDNVLSDGGGAGADVLIGGLGDDTYVLRNAATRIVEAAQGGLDRVAAGVDFRLAAGLAVEALTTASSTGTAPLSLTGNALSQTITGNAGANYLNTGGGAADVLRGLGGDDTYRIHNARDAILEAAGQGTDRVLASVDYRLGAGVSVEILATSSRAGTAAIALTGNELGQTVYGNAGANRLDGRGGLDTLVGGAGADQFVFSTAPGASNWDRIADFEAGRDRVALDDAVFAGLRLGDLAPSAFAAEAGGLARDALDRVLYDTATGALYWDADGSGPGARALIARLDAGLALGAGDFVVV